MADNEVEIRVTSRDTSNPEAVRRRWRAAQKGVTEDVKTETGRQRDALGRFTSGAGVEGERAGRNWSSKFRDALKGDGGVSKIASGLVSALMSNFQLSAKTLATGFSLQFVGSVVAGLASGAVKIAQGLGAIVALAPATIAAAGVAFGALKLALSGVGDALKAGLSGDTEAFNKALEGMAPSAQKVLRSVAGLRDEFDDLKDTVQGRFFGPLVDQVQPLADRFLPMIERTLGGIAGRFGEAGANTSKFLLLPAVSKQISGALTDVQAAVGNLTRGLPNLVAAFLPLVTVGADFLPRLTQGFEGATGRLALFMVEAERTGKIKDFIQRGLDSIKDLFRTGQQLWRIFKNVASVFSTLGGFGGVFSGLGIKAGGLLDALEELTGKAKAFFQTSAGGKAMAQIVVLIRDLLNATMGLFQKLAGIIAPFLPQIAGFATAVQNLMTAVVDAAQPVIEIFLGKILPAVTKVVEYITKNTPLLQGILIGLFVAWAASAGAAAVATIAAALPFIALGVAIAALAALVIIHFDTIKRWFSNVFNWVKDNWPLLFAIFTGPIGLAVKWIKDHWDGIVEFFKLLPGRITKAVDGMFDAIYREALDVFTRVAGLLNKLPGPDVIKVTGHAYQPSEGILGPGPSRGPKPRAMAHGGIGGGLLQLAERGRELLQLPSGQGVLVGGVPQGSTVHPNGRTEGMLGRGGAVEATVRWVPSGEPIVDAILQGLRIKIQQSHGGDPVAALSYRR